VADVLAVAQDIERRLRGTSSPALVPALTDVKEQLTGLVYPGFVTATGWEKLADLSRYLRGIQRRLDKLPQDPYRDRERMLKVHQMQRLYEETLHRLPPERRSSPELTRIRWMIEELRVSYFAQVLGTPMPISDKRIRKALEELAA
jgi:ATP-dependent helicase HrpA